MPTLSIIRRLFRRAAQIGPSRIQIGCADEVIAATTGTFRIHEGAVDCGFNRARLIESGKNVIATEVRGRPMGQPWKTNGPA